MASALKNLSEFTDKNLNDISQKVFAVVTSEWNSEITEALRTGAVGLLEELGARPGNIRQMYVPGSFELSYGAQVAAAEPDVDAVICLGCVIQGETRHFDFICQAVAQGVTDVSLKYDKPVIFGLLTPDTQEQAADRAGGKHGNKGTEAAVTAVKMLGGMEAFRAKK